MSKGFDLDIDIEIQLLVGELVGGSEIKVYRETSC